MNRWYVKEHESPIVPMLRWEIVEILPSGRHCHVRWVENMAEVAEFTNSAIPELWNQEH